MAKRSLPIYSSTLYYSLLSGFPTPKFTILESCKIWAQFILQIGFYLVCLFSYSDFPPLKFRLS